jgi:hypothetical protein
MGHCVGGYNPADQDIYSLWDSKDNSHVTVEVTNESGGNVETVDGEPYRKNVQQIKGKGNAAPVERYRQPTIDFIKKMGFNVIGDGDNVGMVEWKSKYYFPDSDEYEHIFQTEIKPMQDKAIADIMARIEEVPDAA